MDEVTLTLSRNGVGQLLDGIDVLIEQWEATAEYLDTGRIREDVCLRESHSLHEAEAIAEIYRQLRDRIWEQLPVRQ